VIPEIAGRGCVFVRDRQSQRIIGIVTGSDLAIQFGSMAKPFSFVEEAERRLRRRVDEVFTIDQIRAAVGGRQNRIQSSADLTFGNYGYLLRALQDFRRLGWPLDHAIFLETLEKVRKLRNELMHFSTDPLTAEQLDALTSFLALLRTVDPRP
jgi:restriction system protein